MANYDSDFNVRLATLEALGGDITQQFDSVYSIDLEILKVTQQGGGGGNAGGYICVDSVAALSGVTDPKQGMVASVGNIGLFQYYSGATGDTKWVEYFVDVDNMSQEEINAMCNNYAAYKQTLLIKKNYTDRSETTKYIFGQPIINASTTNDRLRFTTSPYTHTDGRMYIRNFYYSKNASTGDWSVGSPTQIEVPKNVTDEIAKVVYRDYNSSVSLSQFLQFYVMNASGSSTGSVFSTTITVDPSASSKVKVATLKGIQNSDIHIKDNGEVFVNNQGFGVLLEVNADWTIFSYTFNHSGALSQTFNIYAVKVIDNQDDTFTVKIFKQDNLTITWDGGQPYSWTEETDQTISYSPHLYTITRKGVQGVSDNYIYKFI